MNETYPGRSKEDYLEAILFIQREKGTCYSIDVVNRLEYSKPSISIAVKNLEKEGFIYREGNALMLTEKGLSVAERTVRKHEFFRGLLERAGVSPETAEEDACRIEHGVSDESFEKLVTWVKKLAGD